MNEGPDIRQRTVFEGPEAEAALVQLAIEREGIVAVVGRAHDFVARQRALVYVLDDAHIDQARTIASRFENRANPSDTLSPSWKCSACGETGEGQFHTCWNCGTPRPQRL